MLCYAAKNVSLNVYSKTTVENTIKTLIHHMKVDFNIGRFVLFAQQQSDRISLIFHVSVIQEGMIRINSFNLDLD